MATTPIRVSLCGGSKCCPAVVVDKTRAQVRLGERGNLVTLDARAWNALVRKIRSGQLKRV